MRIVSAQKWAWQNSEKSLPVYVKSLSSGLKVHLGSGPINLQGWVNIDVRSASHVHLQSNGFELSEFADGAISEIYLCHVLEHFSFDEAKSLLKSLKIKMQNGGVIRISVPSFDKLIEIYESCGSDINMVKFALMGGQDYQHNFHKSIYNLRSLRELLEHCGYSNIKEWETLVEFGAELGDWSSRTFGTANGRLPISLNLKGTN